MTESALHARALLQRHRDRLETRHEEDQEAQQLQKRSHMSTRKTAQGDRIEKFPDVSNRGKRIAEVRELMAEAYEKAEKAAALKRRMANVNTADTERFPVLGGGQR